MRSRPIALLLLSLLATAPPVAHAGWPAGGLQMTHYFYQHPIGPGRLEPDPSGDVLALVRRFGNGYAIWYASRVTPTGEFAPGWAANGTRFDIDYIGPGGFPVSVDGAGGIWHVESGGGDILLERATPDGTVEPSVPAWWAITQNPVFEGYTAVETDGGTGAFVAWWRGFQEFYLLHVGSGGAAEAGWPTGGKRLVSASQTQDIRPAMLADGAGGVVILVGSSAGLHLFRVDGSGAAPAGWPIGGGEMLDTVDATSLDLVRSDASHVFVVWTNASDGSVQCVRVPIAGSGDPEWPGAGVELFTSTQDVTGLDLAPDGQGGLHALGSSSADGARWQHVAPNGSLAQGFPAGGLSPLDGAAVLAPGEPALVAASGRDGGLVVCWRDLRPGEVGVRARWLLADGTPDPDEPAAGRVVVLDESPYTRRPLAALTDGDGGAYVLWSDFAPLPYAITARLTRLYRSDLLGAPPRASAPLALAITPNPASGALAARFTLAEGGAARLTLHDLAGRLLRAREIAGAGERTERFDDLGALAPGVYVIQLAQGGAVRTARVALIR